MNIELKNKFTGQWKKYFKDSEMPLVFYYTDAVGKNIRKSEPSGKWSCLICELF